MSNDPFGMSRGLESSMREMHNMARQKRQMEDDNHTNAQSLLASSQAMESLLDGQSTFVAIHDSVQDLSNSAPEDHDTLIAAFGLIIDQVRFQHPHTIILSGTDDSGNRSSVVAHFSQIVIRVIYLPRVSEDAPREVGFHTI